MKIPLKYNIGSLWIRRVGTLMTAMGIGLTVAICVIMLALIHGLDSTFVDTGHANYLIVIRQGSLNEMNSYFNRDLYAVISLLPGIRKNEKGEPLTSGEIVVVINHPRMTGETSNVMVRGVGPAAFQLRPEINLVQGRIFHSGMRELIVSRPIANRFHNMQLGSTVHLSHSEWKIVGIFDAGGTAYDSEIWGDYNDIAIDWDRPIYSSILVAAEDALSAKALEQRIADDRRIHLQAISQTEYYRSQTISSIGLKALGSFIALIMGIGSCFAAMNMMYAMVMSRTREIATLRTLGFGRFSILFSFVLESIVLALIGGFLGCLMALPMHGVSTGTANFTNFSEILFHFRITPQILLQGMILSGLLGLVGGFLPARKASRTQLLEALRE
jgi:putative ABC transport system permease protein